ncbi:MAG: DNA polymerase III subunit delta [Ignavibacteriales bacterium]|nr:DNA polymerase III subunit delta [Ignavibacteriales bacterium]
MGKQAIPSVQEIEPYIKKRHYYPVYFLFGDDTYQIDQTIEFLDETFAQSVNMDFDKRVYYAKAPAEEILSDIQSYPLGGQKKIIIIKEFEQRAEKEKSRFTQIFKDPPSHTHILISSAGKITSFSADYLKVLTEKGFAFECKSLRADSLEEWVIQTFSKKSKTISHDDARYLLLICGEERNVLEMQMEKVLLYMGEQQRVTTEIINAQVVATKKYQIFDLDKAIENNKPKEAFKVAFALMHQGEHPLILLGYLNKYFTSIARMPEIIDKKLQPIDAARILGIPAWTYPKYVQAVKKYPAYRLKNISKALLEADISIKTSRFDEKTIIAQLLTVLFE